MASYRHGAPTGATPPPAAQRFRIQTSTYRQWGGNKLRAVGQVGGGQKSGSHGEIFARARSTQEYVALKDNPKSKFNTKNLQQRFRSARSGRERLQALVSANNPGAVDLKK